MKSLVKPQQHIKKIRQSAKILASVLKDLGRRVHPGVDLMELERLARDKIVAQGAKPAFLGYQPYGARKPYPFALCTSVNEVVVHGVPHRYMLEEGDVLKLDLGVDWEGGISDAAITVPVGRVSEKDKKLIEVTRLALERGIKAIAPGNTIGDIGAAIEKTIREAGANVIDGLTGHGVGYEVHEEPSVYNFGKPGEGIPLQEGMVLALEPMVTFGSSRIEQLSDDSFATVDGSNSAQFEHTVLVTKRGAEILTR